MRVQFENSGGEFKQPQLWRNKTNDQAFTI